MAIHMRNGIPYGGIPNGIVSGETPSTVPTTVKQLNQVGAVGKIAPVTIPSAVKFSNGDTLETAIGSVATIETSPTVAAHEVGEFIFYNGQMYRVIAAIAVGETLTVDTNIEATSVGAELTSLNNGLTRVTDSIVFRNLTVMGNGTTSANKDVALSGYTPFVAIPTGAIGDLTAMTELYNNSISGNTATFMWSSAKSSSVGIGFIVIYKKNV